MNPFIYQDNSKRYIAASNTQARLKVLQTFDIEKCQQALKLGGIQQEVKKALRSRLNKLERVSHK